MKKVSDLVYEVLDDDLVLTTFLEGRIYPNIAEQEVEAPYVVFAVAVDKGVCRGEPNDFDGQLQVEVYHEQYELLQELKDRIKDVMSDKTVENDEVVMTMGRMEESLDEDMDEENVKVLQCNVFGTIK